MRKRYVRGHSRKVEKNKNEEQKSPLADAGIVLAFLSASSYLLAFSYEKGYKGYYGLNEIFLSDIKIIDILWAVTSIASIATLGYYIKYVYSEIININSENPVIIALNYKFAPIGFLIILSMLLVTREPNILILFAISLVFLIAWIFLIEPYLFIKNENGYKNRMKKYVQNVNKSTLFETYKSLYRINKLAFVIGLSFLLLGASGFVDLFGRNQASLASNYMVVTQKNKNYVVISNQDGNYIIAPVSIKKSVMKSKFIIIEGKSEFSKPIVFKLTHFKNGLKVE